MKFSRNDLREKMSGISRMRRTAVALAATQRLSQMHDQWATSQPSIGKRLCERFWTCLIQGTPPTESLAEHDIEALFPGEGRDDHILALGAEDFATALLYTLRSYGENDVNNAAFALERASEYPYQLAINLFDKRTANTHDPSVDETIAHFPMLMRELEAQESDFGIASASHEDKLVFLQLRDNSRAAAYFTEKEFQIMKNLIPN